jgi:hypothetical protein
LKVKITSSTLIASPSWNLAFGLRW